MKQLLRLDIALTKKLYKKPAFLRPIMVWVSRLGRPVVIMLVCGLIGFMSFLYGHASIAIGFGLCLIALALSGLLKSVLKRERPTSLYVSHMRIQSFSFPSGHALGTLVLYGYIMALAFAFLTESAAVACAYLFSVLIIFTGLSRVYLGAHFVGDVLGGWLLGALALLAIIRITL